MFVNILKGRLMGEKQILSTDDIRRAITRVAHEVAERNEGVDSVVLVGIRRRGVPLAQRIAATLADLEGERVPVGTLDITLYRDDLGLRGPAPIVRSTSIPTDITDRTVVLVDDVMTSGATANAASRALLRAGAKRVDVLVFARVVTGA